ncbi:MAG TPA: hypothetical protein VMS78_12480 [Rhizomicrobium sp.]|nr:hypothetical protein [Rhizomicrobium sp.]
MRNSMLAIIAAFSFTGVAMAAEAPPAQRPAILRGTVTSFDGKTIGIRVKTGEVMSLAVMDKTTFSAVEPRRFDQLKTTDFIGVTSVPGKHGHLRAEEVHIIPQVGLGEGQYPWDHHPDGAGSPKRAGSMTNGEIETARTAPQAAGSMTNGMVESGGKRQLTVSYRGAETVDGKCVGLAVPGKPGCTGKSIIDVPSRTPIAAIVPAKADEVKPGLAIVGFAVKAPNGQSVLASATIERNHVKPEF